jgi:hypothetical protein
MRLWFHSLSIWTALVTISFAQDSTEGVRNANHVFNAIHAVMRHPILSEYPNGVSFFLATIPKGIQFYHGTGEEHPVTGLEWLAFEPEHSLGFAHRSGRRLEPRERETSQKPLKEKDPLASTHGYLHTYVSAKDLRLLYLDGMSAGPMRSLEAQDRILFNDSIPHNERPGGGRPGQRSEVEQRGKKLGGPPSEQARALQACQMAEEKWAGRIDGLLRTEGDFEIILCHFERDLDLVRISETKPQKSSGNDSHGPGGKKPGRKPGRAVTSRYDDLRGHQAIIDFDHVVSAYTYNLDLFPNNTKLPQLSHITLEELIPIRLAIDSMILNNEPSRSAFNWQAVTDVVIDRYSSQLRSVVEGDFQSLVALRENLEIFLEPFIDYKDYQNSYAIIDSCQRQLIPHSTPDSGLASEAVRYILHRICTTFTYTLLDSQMDLETAVGGFAELVSYLSWVE